MLEVQIKEPVEKTLTLEDLDIMDVFTTESSGFIFVKCQSPKGKG